MCEVNSCCCFTLRQGCIFIGGVTILVSIVQTLIFSWVLVETYQSYKSSLNYQAALDTNSSMVESAASTYTFASNKCPYGFMPLATQYSNDLTEEEYQDEVEVNITHTLISTLSSTTEAPKSDAVIGSQASPLALELTIEDEDPIPIPSVQTVIQLKDDTNTSDQQVTSPISSSLMPSPASSPSSSNSSTNDSFLLIEVSSSLAASSASDPLYASSSSFRALNKTRIKCLAPGQGLLWTLVVVSALYSLVGLVLIYAISYCISWQLSIWFFYTVGYDLFTLIVAMTDGNYTSLSDISSYVACVITTYCVIVVDSYYEKQLLHDERTDKNGGNRRRSSLVIVRSSPDTPTSTQPEYIPPTSYRVSTNPNTLAPPPAHNLGPLPQRTLAPPSANSANPMKLAPPPSRPPSYPGSAERSRQHPQHAHHNNV